MRLILFSSLLICFHAYAQDYKKLHFKSILIDTHNDIPSKAIEKGYCFDQDLAGKTHSDLQRMKQGGVDAQFFSIWCDGNQQNPYAWANREIDSVLAWTKRNPSSMMQAFSAKDIVTASKQKKLAVLLGVEGGHMIENDLSKLDAFYNRGVRYMTLTWNNSTDWATSAAFEASPPAPLHGVERGVTSPPAPLHGVERGVTSPPAPSPQGGEGGNATPAERKMGLTDFGKQVVKRMNELGMIVDISHVGEKTFWDVISTTTKPVIASHSCAYSLCAHSRNLKDDQIKAIGKNGGVIHLNFYSGFVDPEYDNRNKAFLEKHTYEADSLLKLNPEPYFMQVYLYEKYPQEVKAMRPALSLLIDHLDYIVRLIGVDHVGIGSDFDGVNSLPQQLDDVTTYPLITKALLERGYARKDIKKILGGNFLRVFSKNTGD